MSKSHKGVFQPLIKDTIQALGRSEGCIEQRSLEGSQVTPLASSFEISLALAPRKSGCSGVVLETSIL